MKTFQKWNVFFNNMEIKPIAKIANDYVQKFGIPKQSRLIKSIKSKIIFEPEFRKEGIIKGLEATTHIWIIWCFSENIKKGWSPTVRPPRLGGNQKFGVFATRSPFRPNAIGLSAVEISKIYQNTPEGPIIEVCGADLMNGTPILDIKPYIPYADCIQTATNTIFGAKDSTIKVSLNKDVITDNLDKEKVENIIQILQERPTPRYQCDPTKIYKFEFSNIHIEYKQTKEEIIITNMTQIE